MAARVGGLLAPQVVLFLPSITSQHAPMVLMGTCALLGAGLTLWLPETLGSLTVQSVRDVEDLRIVTKPFFAYWSNERLKSHLSNLTEERKRF